VILPARRFPPPWSVEEYNDACFIVRDNDGQQLAYVYFEEEPGPPTIGWVPVFLFEPPPGALARLSLHPPSAHSQQSPVPPDPVQHQV